MTEAATTEHNHAAHRERAAVALAQGATIHAAAKAAHVSQRTLYRWLEEPAFVERIRQEQRWLLAQLRGMIVGVQAEAIEIVLTILRSPTTPVSVRMHGGLKLLDLAVRISESFDLEERLSAVEAAQRLLEGRTDDIDYRGS